MTERDRHGGNVHAASRELGLPLRRVLDFSASINPLGSSRRAVRALVKTLPDLRHYPDPDSSALREALSRRYRIPADLFVISNGSTELIHLIPRLIGGDAARVLIIGPTFSEYARAIGQHGGSVVDLYADRKSDYDPPIHDAIREVSRASCTAIILCNPNSPTGRVISAPAMRKLLEVASSRDIWVVVDETFVDYAPTYSVARDAARYPQALVLRSFTKFYALPGLRIGYAIGGAEVAAQMRALQPPWSVNMLAQAAALAALSDERHEARSLRFMSRERLRFARRLSKLPGVKVFPSEANFLLSEISGQARDTTAALRRRGVLIRDCSAVPGLTDGSIRIAVRSRVENNHLVELLQPLLAHGE